MNLFELVTFLFVCLGLGLLGRLVSPRYGWLAGVVLAATVFVLMLIGTFERHLIEKPVRIVCKT